MLTKYIAVSDEDYGGLKGPVVAYKTAQAAAAWAHLNFEGREWIICKLLILEDESPAASGRPAASDRSPTSGRSSPTQSPAELSSGRLSSRKFILTENLSYSGFAPMCRDTSDTFNEALMPNVFAFSGAIAALQYADQYGYFEPRAIPVSMHQPAGAANRAAPRRVRALRPEKSETHPSGARTP